MAAGDNQKLKMLYLVKIFSEETDDSHALSLQEIAERLEAYGVNAERKTLYKDFAELEKFGL
ncbi:MAG: WYL domain-containing protein, partial [Oscillospiraceae bacterium]|nr:WYL domain-containing protein [Oscillospiraceae bacterium]